MKSTSIIEVIEENAKVKKSTMLIGRSGQLIEAVSIGNGVVNVILDKVSRETTKFHISYVDEYWRLKL